MVAHFTLFEGAIACGVNNVNTFDCHTAAQRLATDVFIDYFSVCIENLFEEVGANFNSYSDLTTAQVHTRLILGVKKNIKTSVQFLYNKTILGRNPEDTPFNSEYAQTYIRQYKCIIN